jgi:hypothetical protein
MVRYIYDYIIVAPWSKKKQVYRYEIDAGVVGLPRMARNKAEACSSIFCLLGQVKSSRQDV